MRKFFCRFSFKNLYMKSKQTLEIILFDIFPKKNLCNSSFIRIIRWQLKLDEKA